MQKMKQNIDDTFPIVNSVRKIGYGHTLHLVDYKFKRFGYKGEVGFDGISLWATGQTLLRDRRWGIAFVEGDFLNLLCTGQDKGTKGYQYQHIYHYKSSDGIYFKEVDTICRGSAPWVYRDRDKLYFYYHIFDGKNHNIYVREGLTGESKLILSDTKVYSAPSVIKWKGHYLMTLEHRVNNGVPWETVITKMDSPTDMLKNFVSFLGEWQACCFLHDGFITYSQKGNDGWDIRQAKLR